MPVVDRVLGYPETCTIADNGAGKVRVTLQGNALDPKFYAAIAVDGSHYLDNVTQAGGTAAVTAKGGTKAQGYYFDLGGVNFPSASWAAADRICPIRQSTAYNYTAWATLHAAASSMDTAILFGLSTTQTRYDWDATNLVGKGFSIWGGPLGQKIVLHGSNFSGDLSSQTSMVTIENCLINGHGGYSGIVYAPGNGTPGAGLLVSRCILVGLAQAIYAQQYAGDNLVQAVNCVFAHNLNALYSYQATWKMVAINCTFIENSSGNYFKAASTITNCLFVGNVSDGTTTTKLNCASDQGCVGTGCLQNQTLAQLALWSGNDNGIGVRAGRILTTSTCYGAGTATGAPTVDIDYNTRAATPSIGAHEGTVNAYGVTWLAAGVLHTDQSQISFAGTITGTMPRTTVVPTALTLTAYADGDTTVTVSNIASIAATDVLEIYLDGVSIYKISRAKYEAVVEDKPANCGRISCLARGTAYAANRFTAKYTSDLYVYGAASANPANPVTPDLDVTDTRFLVKEALSTRNQVVTPLSAVPSPANGGPAAWTQLGVSRVGTGDKVLSLVNEVARNTIVATKVEALHAYLHLGAPAEGELPVLVGLPIIDLRPVHTAPGEDYVASFFLGQTVRAAGSLLFEKPTTATVTLAVQKTDGSSGQTLLWNKVVDFLAGVSKTYAEMNDDEEVDWTPGEAEDWELILTVAEYPEVDDRAGFAVLDPDTLDTPDPADVRETTTTGGEPGEIPQSDIEVASGGTLNLATLLAGAYASGYAAAEAFFGAWEAARNTALSASKVALGWVFRQFGIDDIGELDIVEPEAPSWGAAPVAGDGKVTLNVLTVNPTDKVYARSASFSFAPSWSAESEIFQRTGSGPIVMTGLPNEQFRMFTIYVKKNGLTSVALAPRFKTPTAGAQAVIEQIMDAVTDQVNALGLTSKSEAGAAVAIAAEVEIPPKFASVNTPGVKVYPDTEEAEPVRSRNQVTYRVNVAFCQRSKAVVQQEEQFRIREMLRDQFLGKRLVAMPTAVCVGESESEIVDLQKLFENFQWVSNITLEFQTLKARG